MIYKFKTSLTVLVFFLIAFLSYEKHHYNLVSHQELKTVREKLSLLSPQEKKDLDCFFHEGIVFSPYPYTLVGYKPMSILTFLEDSEDLPPILRADYKRPIHRKYADSLKQGYQAWEKYQSLFPMKKYILLKYHPPHCKGINRVVLINLDLCFSTIRDHLGDFQEILQNPSKPEELFAILVGVHPENFDKIMEHDRLLGILLGFGRNNAHLYEKKQFQKLASFTNEWPIWPKKWVLPGFSCDPDTEETKQLKDKYKQARKYIRWTYFGRNDLEVTLALLLQQE